MSNRVGELSKLLISREIKDKNRRRITLVKTPDTVATGDDYIEKHDVTTDDASNIGDFEIPIDDLDEDENSLRYGRFEKHESDNLVFLFPSCVEYIDDLIGYKEIRKFTKEDYKKSIRFSAHDIFAMLEGYMCSETQPLEQQQQSPALSEKIANCFIGLLAEGAHLSLTPPAKVPEFVREFSPREEKERLANSVSVTNAPLNTYVSMRLNHIVSSMDYYSYSHDSMQLFYGMCGFDNDPKFKQAIESTQRNPFGLPYAYGSCPFTSERTVVTNIFGYGPPDSLLGFLLARGLTSTAFLRSINVVNFYAWSSTLRASQELPTQADVGVHVANILNHTVPYDPDRVKNFVEHVPPIADGSTQTLRTAYANITYALLCSSLAFLKLLTHMFVEAYVHGGVLPQLPLFLEHYLIEYVAHKNARATNWATSKLPYHPTDVYDAFMVDVVTEYLFSAPSNKRVRANVISEGDIVSVKMYELPPYLEVWALLKDFFGEVYFHPVLGDNVSKKFLRQQAVTQFMTWALKLEASFFGLASDLVPHNELLTPALEKSAPFRIYAEQAANGHFVTQFADSERVARRISSLSRYIDNQCLFLGGLRESVHLYAPQGETETTPPQKQQPAKPRGEEGALSASTAEQKINEEAENFFAQIIYPQDDSKGCSGSVITTEIQAEKDLQTVRFMVDTDARLVKMLPALVECIASMRNHFYSIENPDGRDAVFNNMAKMILVMVDVCRQIICTNHVVLPNVNVDDELREDFFKIAKAVTLLGRRSCVGRDGSSKFHTFCRARTMQWIHLKMCRLANFQLLSPCDFPTLAEETDTPLVSDEPRTVPLPRIDFDAFDRYGDGFSDSILGLDSRKSRVYNLVMEQLATSSSKDSSFLVAAMLKGFVPASFPISDLGIAMQNVYIDLVKNISKLKFSVRGSSTTFLPCIVKGREDWLDFECFVAPSALYRMKFKEKPLFSAETGERHGHFDVLLKEIFGGNPTYNQIYSLSPEFMATELGAALRFMPSVSKNIGEKKFGMDDLRKHIMANDFHELPINLADHVALLYLVDQLDNGGVGGGGASFGAPSIYMPFFDNGQSMFSEYQHEVYLRELVPDIYNDILKKPPGGMQKKPKLTIDIDVEEEEEVETISIYSPKDRITLLGKFHERAVGCFDMAHSLVKIIVAEKERLVIAKGVIPNDKVLDAANSIVDLVHTRTEERDAAKIKAVLENDEDPLAVLVITKCVEDSKLFGIRYKEADTGAVSVPNVFFLSCLLRTILSVPPFVLDGKHNILNVRRAKQAAPLSALVKNINDILSKK